MKMLMKMFGFYSLFISLAMIFAENTNASTSNKIETCPYEAAIHTYNGDTYFCGIHKYLGKEVFRKSAAKHEAVVLKDIDAGPGGLHRKLFLIWGTTYFLLQKQLERAGHSGEQTVPNRALN